MGGIQRCNNLPVFISDGKQIVSNSEKAEELVRTFIKVHSNGNISNKLRRHMGAMFDRKEERCFWILLVGLKHTSPGKDKVCYEVIRNLSDISLNIYFKTF